MDGAEEIHQDEERKNINATPDDQPKSTSEFVENKSSSHSRSKAENKHQHCKDAASEFLYHKISSHSSKDNQRHKHEMPESVHSGSSHHSSSKNEKRCHQEKEVKLEFFDENLGSHSSRVQENCKDSTAFEGFAKTEPVGVLECEGVGMNLRDFISESQMENKKDVKGVPDDNSNSLMYSALQNIDDIVAEAEVLRQQLENFSGSSTDDRDYIYLEEMLIRCTIRLDNIEANGDENIKQERKQAIQYIQKLMKILDSRLKENQRSIKRYKFLESDDEVD